MKDNIRIRTSTVLVILLVIIIPDIYWSTFYGGRTGPDKAGNTNISLNVNSPAVSTTSNFTHPNMYLNMDEIKAIKVRVDANEEPWKTAYNAMISEANSVLKEQTPSVTYGGKTPPSGNKHDYYSELPYSTDGVFDKSRDRTDYQSAIKLGRNVRSLGLAYAFTGEGKYADKALEFIRVWSIDPPTRMNPRFTDWQSKIEIAITLPGMFYGAELIWNYQGWTPADKDAFKSWTARILEDAKNWSAENNFENWRLVFISSASVITEDSESMTYAFDQWKAIISSQMDLNGSMIKETGRTNSLSYSLYAINAMIQTAEIARHYGVDLYDYRLEDGRGLEKALDFHAPYAADPSKWPYQQITAYAGDNAALYELAYSFRRKPSYLDIINKWKRPMYESRTMGPVTLTHSFNAYPFTFAGIN
ncbi:MAG: alginate lyase family protein [Candidatus Methanoperedens sp.]|nr:alginate lyase family protein [Candidatus Methanoperedens sp.]